VQVWVSDSGSGLGCHSEVSTDSNQPAMLSRQHQWCWVLPLLRLSLHLKSRYNAFRRRQWHWYVAQEAAVTRAERRRQELEAKAAAREQVSK
jgi:hypothetical protein